MALVELRFTPLPEHVRTARLVVVSLARRAGADEETLDEVRLAVGEACTRAVRRHQATCPDQPVLVRMTDGAGRFVAEVVDRAPGHPTDPDSALGALAASAGADGDEDDGLPPGLDLAVIVGLVDDVTVSEDAEGSTVQMAWPIVARTASGTPAFGGSATSA